MIKVSFYDFSSNKMFEKEFANMYNLKVFLQRICYGKSSLLPHHYSMCGVSNHAYNEYSEEIDYWRSRIKQNLIKLHIFDLSKLYG